MSECVLSPTLRQGRQVICADHRAHRSGANVLTLISCSAELGVELQSTYTGDERTAAVLVAEYALIGRQRASIEPRWLRGGEGILTYAPRLCLVDHLHRFCELVHAHSGQPLVVEDLELAERQLADAELPI